MDTAVTRDLGLIVTGPDGFFSEEKRHASHVTEMPVPGVPLYRITSTCNQGRYRIVKTVLSDPDRPVVLQHIEVEILKGRPGDYHVFALLAAHIANHGAGNYAWLDDFKGQAGLFASRGDTSLCLMADTGFEDRSVGYVGSSDGWQDLMRHGQLTWHFTHADDGNVALTGELRLLDGKTLVALGVGRSPAEAAIQARGSLNEGFTRAEQAYTAPWQRWQRGLDARQTATLSQVSAMVVRAHYSKHIPGAILASLSVPWGFARGDGDLGGYHLVWARDMVESAGGLLAAGDHQAVRQALTYLEATQEGDGHWLQNMWLEGDAYWSGVQMDETALPILLVDQAVREGALTPDDVRRLWPMVRRAAAYVVQNGPVTQQDRWEEDGGYTPFTLSAEIASLLAAADLGERVGEASHGAYLRETADAWNAQIERWLYVKETDIAKRVGVDGYYVRLTPPDLEAGDGFTPIKNRPLAASQQPSAEIVSADALAFVRFGLRAADDPRILNTVKVIDAVLRTETPSGPSWHRYNEDGYGEKEDGSPFEETGIGRLWPLLTGERAHYAIAAGQLDEARRLQGAVEAMAGEGGLIPEQVWDQEDIPERELVKGRPSGSAMPLVWAHAEYLKLVRSLADGRVFDTPPAAYARYVEAKTPSRHSVWRFNHKVRTMASGTRLRLEVLATATVHWSVDNWATAADAATGDSGWGVQYVDLPTEDLPAGAAVQFTFFWPEGEGGRWEGTDFTVEVGDHNG